MSESDGLLKLTEYLKQTRRQAELAIDNLNKQLQEVEGENQNLKGKIAQLEHDKSEYKRMFEQLKQETSGKWKFKERDDWKGLVDNIQQDRNRLQEENNQLNTILSTTSQQIEELKLELQRVYTERDELLEKNQQLLTELESKREKSDFLETNNKTVEERVSTTTSGEESTTNELLSPIVDKSTGRRIFTFDGATSPLSTTKRLKDELLKAHSQIEEERKRAEAEKLQQQAEISRLKSTLEDLSKDQQQRPQRRQIAEVRVIHQQKRRKPNDSSGSSGSGWLFGSWLNLMFSESKESTHSVTSFTNQKTSRPHSFESLDSSAPTTILKV